MSDFRWMLDGVYTALVRWPLIVLGTVTVALIVAAAWLVRRALRRENSHADE